MSESSSDKFNITDSTHPEYDLRYNDWVKYRYVMEGGDAFVEHYTKSFSALEDSTDFEKRKEITPLPAFASAAVTDVKNAIYQRMVDVTRSAGPESYQDAITGKNGGINRQGANITYFIGNEVLPELLNMGKVGIYVDMPELDETATMSDTEDAHPYFYVYKAEQIRNWRLSRQGDFMEYDMLLLQERVLTYDDMYNLPDKDVMRYRLFTKEDGQIFVRFFDEAGEQIDINGDPTDEPTVLNISRIPFVILELTHSLLHNVANHQIALVNLESSDVIYSLKSNIPIYVEPQSAANSGHLKSDASEGGDKNAIEMGNTVGRTYPAGSPAPEFIHPSPEPLTASMKKQGQLKEDIRTLINLALSAIQPKYASAQAKEFDEHGLESGLSFIGLVLEHAERQLSGIYSEYEGSEEVATVNYPDRYSLKSDAERFEEAEKLYEVMLKLPSKTAQKTMMKLIVTKLLEAKIPADQLAGILEEIDAAEYITGDPETILGDLEKGLVSTVTASKARGYKAESEVPLAKKEHAERLSRIRAAQTNDDGGARGVADVDGDPSVSAKVEKEESQNADLQDDSKKPVRG
jgi:hypothetical protein